MDNEMLTYLAFLLGGGGSGSFTETGVVATAAEDVPVTFNQFGDYIMALFPSPPASMVEAFSAHWGEPIEVQFADDGIVRSLSYDNTQHYYAGDDTMLSFDVAQLAIADSTGNHSSGDSTTVTINFVGETLTESFQDALDVAVAQKQVAQPPATIYIDWDDEKAYKDSAKTPFTSQSDAQAFIGDSMPTVRDSTAVYTPLGLSLGEQAGSVEIAYSDDGSLATGNFELYSRLA